jgi:tetratricopeptide (TPR) repeat protein
LNTKPTIKRSPACSFGLIFALLAAFALASLPEPAHAQKSAEPITRAHQLGKEGFRLGVQKHYAKALVKFKAAFKLHPVAIYAHNMARAYEELNNYPEAFAYFTIALRLDATYRYARLARQKLVRVRRILIKTHAWLRLTSAPGQVQVSLKRGQDEPIQITSPSERWIPAGRYQLVASKVGFMTKKQNVQIKAGPSHPININLKPVPATGFLTITTNHLGAIIYIDGKKVGLAPIKGLRIDAGIRQVELRVDGRAVYSKSITVHADRSISVSASLKLPTQGPSRSQRITGYALYGTGAAVLITGIILHAAAASKAHTLESIPAYDLSSINTQSANYEQLTIEKNAFDAQFSTDYSTFRALETGAWISYGVALGLLGTATYYTFFARKTRSTQANVNIVHSDSIRLIPRLSVSPHGARIGALLQF